MNNGYPKLWLPADWLDEIIPECLPSPDDFIHKTATGFELRCPKGSLDHDNEFYQQPLSDGDVVTFYWTERYGQHIIDVREDQTWSSATWWPDRANCFALDGDVDTLQDNMHALVEGGSYIEPLDPGAHSVSIYYWSEGTHFRFDAANVAFVAVAVN